MILLKESLYKKENKKKTLLHVLRVFFPTLFKIVQMVPNCTKHHIILMMCLTILILVSHL